jgi:hypothetical protein
MVDDPGLSARKNNGGASCHDVPRPSFPVDQGMETNVLVPFRDEQAYRGKK